jgi:ATP-dependent DNA helicase RecG
MNLDHMSLSLLKGVGDKMLEKLHRLGLETVQDLLFHLPLRYEDRTRVLPIAELRPGMHVSVLGEIVDNHISYGRKRMLICRLRDPSGTLTLRFFNFAAAQKNSLAAGTRIRAFGEIRPGHHGLEIIHPEYSLQQGEQPIAAETSLTPVYGTTEGLRQLTLRQLSDQALALLEQQPLRELLPEGLYHHQLGLNEAVRLLHRPPPDVALPQLEQGQHPAQRRLVLEELLAHNLSVLKVREQSQAHRARPLPCPQALLDRFLGQLPFSPTGAQRRVVAEIGADLQKTVPMMRLVQGDVGSGKTLVAALAALQAIGNGFQVALMAPTELLAEQHANNFAAWLAPLGIQVGWLAGKVKGKARAEATGTARQRRAGHGGRHPRAVPGAGAVQRPGAGDHRRAAPLRRAPAPGPARKGTQPGRPHQLIMTATPIPRTLAMTAYADLDTSVIDELPPGRTPVTTVAIPTAAATRWWRGCAQPAASRAARPTGSAP